MCRVFDWRHRFLVCFKYVCVLFVNAKGEKFFTISINVSGAMLVWICFSVAGFESFVFSLEAEAVSFLHRIERVCANLEQCCALVVTLIIFAMCRIK